MNGKNVFVVKMNNFGMKDYALENSKVVIGWTGYNEIKDINTKQLSPKKRKEEIKGIIRRKGNNNKGSVGQVAGILDRFIFQISLGDSIIFPWSNGFYLGTVKRGDGDRAKFNKSECINDSYWEWDVGWNRDKDGEVKWYSRYILNSKLCMASKARLTCTMPGSESYDDLQEAIKSPFIDIGYNLVKNSDCISDCVKIIQEDLNQLTFEKFLMNILKKSGAIKVEKNKEKSAKGDIDIDALFSVNCASDDDKSDLFRYGYQCKRHVGKTNEKAVKQLIDRATDEKSKYEYRKLFAVTTAEFSVEAKELAEKFNQENQGTCPEIVLMEGEDLAKWMFGLGIKGLEIFNEDSNNVSNLVASSKVA